MHGLVVEQRKIKLQWALWQQAAGCLAGLTLPALRPAQGRSGQRRQWEPALLINCIFSFLLPASLPYPP